MALAVHAAHVGRVAPERFQPLRIAVDRCKGCSLCIGVCRGEALALDPQSVNALGYHGVRLVDSAACTSCALCARICPDAVFTVYAPPKRS